MRLAKLHGLGNDFLVALDEVNGRALTEVGPELARSLCERHTGLGADGLIRGEVPTEAERHDGVDVVMHLFNSDGSRAELSGNGLRCLVHALAHARRSDNDAFVVRTDAGDRAGRVEPGGATHEAWVEVTMGEGHEGPAVPPSLQEQLAGHDHATFDLGNPHLVVVVDDLDMVDVVGLGQRYEQSFPGGINVEFVQRDTAAGTISLRVWERGAGVTLACGTGACAAAMLATRIGLVPGPTVRVRMPGGIADVTFADGDIMLAGATVLVADVEVHDV